MSLIMAQSEQEENTLQDIDVTRKNIEKERQELARLQSMLQIKAVQQKQLEEKLSFVEESVRQLDITLQCEKQDYVCVLSEKRELENGKRIPNIIIFGMYLLIALFFWSELAR